MDANTKSHTIAYYGPGLSGKETNIRFLAQVAYQRGETTLVREEGVLTCQTMSDRLVPNTLPARPLRLTAVVGATFTNLEVLNIVKHADGIIFVADSLRERLDSNLESVWRMKQALSHHGKCLEDL